MTTGILKFLRCEVPLASATTLVAGCGKIDDAIGQAERKDVATGVPAPGVTETKAVAEEAYICGFPILAA